jgi:hypothetical protein
MSLRTRQGFGAEPDNVPGRAGTGRRTRGPTSRNRVARGRTAGRARVPVRYGLVSPNWYSPAPETDVTLQ